MILSSKNLLMYVCSYCGYLEEMTKWFTKIYWSLQFVDTNFELGSNYSDVIAPQDVATYGGLCALASFDRAELKVWKSFFLIIHICDLCSFWGS